MQTIFNSILFLFHLLVECVAVAVDAIAHCRPAPSCDAYQKQINNKRTHTEKCALGRNGSVPVPMPMPVLGPQHKEKVTTTTTEQKKKNMFLIYLRVMIMFSFTDHEFFCLILRPFTMGLSCEPWRRVHGAQAERGFDIYFIAENGN